ncbi:hypothetical protein [Chryseobacterium sp.]|uniref:FEKKY domain-containing protein n=1 Tax=Chryseobacterium sp. TaxID=1871047 RepID=UPI0011C7ACE2|nr:hypothetical protein [Chryseobacterium sp.]TXF79222.1 hypothetical protein FUA25_02170 [Chryseobacterium sp.]
MYDFNQYGFEYVAAIVLVIALLTALVATLNIKNLDFKNKFLRILPLFNSIFLVFMIFEGVSAFIHQKSKLIKLENAYIARAKKDITKDKIIYEYAGGLALPMYSEKVVKEIDRIHEKYGVTYLNTGCLINYAEIKAQKKYKETVSPYLEKRNGKNWEIKMNAEIEKIKRDSQ